MDRMRAAGLLTLTIWVSGALILPGNAQDSMLNATAPEPSRATLLETLNDGITDDRDASALTALKVMAETDNDAAFALATIYTEGTASVPQDYLLAIPVLERLADGGELRVQVRLGNIYRTIKQPGIDPNKAPAYYLQAAAQGDPTSAYRTAEYLRQGTGAVEKNIPEAIRYYKMAAAAGHVPSLNRLGDLYRSGAENNLDPSEAVGWYEQSAAKGNAIAAYQLAEIYRSGSGVTANTERAVAYYRQAIAGGYGPASLALAQGYLDGTLGDEMADQGIQLLQDGTSSGVEGARLALARAFINATGVPRDVESGVSILEQGVTAQEVDAAQLLIRLYTDGRVPGVPKNPGLARATLERIAPALDAPALNLQALMVEVASATPGNYSTIATNFDGISPGNKVGALARVYSLNRNAYVYLLQNELARKGLYAGELNGLLTDSTIRGINAFCSTAQISNICRLGPLSYGARQAIPRALFSNS